MDDLRAVKGTPTLVAAILQDGHCTHLHHFIDGTWEIERDGRPAGTWEHDEVDNCLGSFLGEATPSSVGPAVLWLNLHEGQVPGDEQSRS